MARFLDGLIYFKRGKDESRPAPPLELPVNNNQILKKLRVAFELRDEDLQAILHAADLQLSKSELGALFRSPAQQLSALRRPAAAQFPQGAFAAPGLSCTAGHLKR